MENETQIGKNRTGIQMSPFDAEEQQQAVEEFQPQVEGKADQLDEVRRTYACEAERLGAVPIPASVKGVASTAAGKLKGENPEVLIDKLGERMAYERSGVRMYQAFIAKVEASEESNAVDLLKDLKHICSEEKEHFHLLWKTISGLGADPTAVTPCAAVAGMQATGIIQVLTEPRTTLDQCLSALLTIELTDHAAWGMLIALARASGKDDMADSFAAPLASENEHERMIRGWAKHLTMDKVG